jgi:hypothetical protein
MTPEQLRRRLQQQKHSVGSPEDNSAEKEDADTLIDNIMSGNKWGDLQVAPGDTLPFDPARIARAIQNGEDW